MMIKRALSWVHEQLWHASLTWDCLWLFKAELDGWNSGNTDTPAAVIPAQRHATAA